MMKDTRAAAEHVGLAPSTLEKRRVFGGGPPYRKLGTKVVYDSADLDAWLEAQPRMNSTAESEDRRGTKAGRTRHANATA